MSLGTKYEPSGLSEESEGKAKSSGNPLLLVYLFSMKSDYSSTVLRNGVVELFAEALDVVFLHNAIFFSTKYVIIPE